MSSNRKIPELWCRQMPTLLFVAVMLAAGCGGGKERPGQSEEVVTGLRVRKIQLETVPDELEAPGNVIAVSTAQVAARTMGTVLQVPVREGDVVKRGQVLAQLDERELSARQSAAQAASEAAKAGVTKANKALALAEAQADVMQKTYDRYLLLKQQNSVSPQEFDEISARQRAAQAELEQAKAGLHESEAAAMQVALEARAAKDVASYARVASPFDGRLIRRMVEPGTLVSGGTTLFIVEDTSRYQLQVTLPAEALALVKKNSSARVQLDALPGRSLVGKVVEIEAGADPDSHTLTARVDLPKNTEVRSGLFGRAFFSRGEKRALLVPSDAIVNHGQLGGIYVVDDAALIHWRVLTFGKATDDQVEVLSGLSQGDSVVLNAGSQELDGRKAGGVATSGEKHP